MAIDTTINAGAPPLLWSDVQAAFDKVNQNFIDVQATIAGSSITPVDFTNLRTDVSPAVDNNYNIGGPSNKWAAVFASEYSTIPGNEYNGVWLGNAHLKGLGTTVDLPLNSTVNGILIIDPDKTAFKEIQVDNNFSIIAGQFSDSFNLLSGTGIELTVNSPGDSIEVNNTGILDIIANDGISVSTVAGSSTITNTGVRSLTSTTSLPSGRTEGTGINISGTSGDDIKITNTGVISLSGGSGIQINYNAVTGEAGIVNLGAVVAFTQIQIGTDIVDKIQADTASDTFIINSGTGITLTKNTTTDTLTIAVNPTFDLTGNLTGDVLGNVTGDTTGYHTGDVKGSVVADDSTILVDGVDGKIVGPVYTSILRTTDTQIRLGRYAGDTNQGNFGISIGNGAADTNQGEQAVALGVNSGSSNQGTYAVAIGVSSGQNNQGSAAIAIGQNAALSSQGTKAISIGFGSGYDTQGTNSISIGNNAGYTTQGTNALAMGYLAGNDTQGTGSIALGYTAAQTTQGDSSVAIGWSAGQTNQGDYAIAIGYRAGFTNQNASSIVLNASGAALEAAAAGFFVNPVRSAANGTPLMYDTVTSELVYSNVLEFVGSRISTTDSSGITVDVVTTFNTDVVVENDLNVTQRLQVQGSRVINLAELKSVVAASTDFADFQIRIAALV